MLCSAASSPSPVTASPRTTGTPAVTRAGSRANPRTSWPAATSAGASSDPIAPLTPVRRMRMDVGSSPMELLRKLRAQARELLPESSFDYFDGGAGDEQTLADNEAAWRRLWISPRVMVDVSLVDPSCELLGQPLAHPILLAPVAAQRLLHPDGEVAAARGAAAAGTVYCLSSRATTDLAAVAAAAPGPLWFQLYMAGDRDHSARVLARAAEHGFRAVVLTVDL